MFGLGTKKPRSLDRFPTDSWAVAPGENDRAPVVARVNVGAKKYIANCSWDALGIAAALHADADVHSRCEQTREPLHLRIRGGRCLPEPSVIHFAVPAAHWWDDIVYT